MSLCNCKWVTPITCFLYELSWLWYLFTSIKTIAKTDLLPREILTTPYLICCTEKHHKRNKGISWWNHCIHPLMWSFRRRSGQHSCFTVCEKLTGDFTNELTICLSFPLESTIYIENLFLMFRDLSKQANKAQWGNL